MPRISTNDENGLSERTKVLNALVALGAVGGKARDVTSQYVLACDPQKRDLLETNTQARNARARVLSSYLQDLKESSDAVLREDKTWVAAQFTAQALVPMPARRNARQFRRLFGRRPEAMVDKGPQPDLAVNEAGQGGIALTRLPVSHLMELACRIPAELQKRGVIRNRNLTGEYAEHLVCKVVGGTLARGSEKAWDVLTKEGKHIQVKARTIRPGTKTSFSIFRSLNEKDGVEPFDEAWFLLFADSDFRLIKAVSAPIDFVRDRAKHKGYENGYILGSAEIDGNDPRLEDKTDDVREAIATLDAFRAAA